MPEKPEEEYSVSHHYYINMAKKQITTINCNFCPYTTKCSSNLKKHLRTHTGEKQLNCKTCTHKFGNQSNLKNHEKRCKKQEKPEQKSSVTHQPIIRHSILVLYHWDPISKHLASSETKYPLQPLTHPLTKCIGSSVVTWAIHRPAGYAAGKNAPFVSTKTWYMIKGA